MQINSNRVSVTPGVVGPDGRKMIVLYEHTQPYMELATKFLKLNLPEQADN